MPSSAVFTLREQYFSLDRNIPDNCHQKGGERRLSSCPLLAPRSVLSVRIQIPRLLSAAQWYVCRLPFRCSLRLWISSQRFIHAQPATFRLHACLHNRLGKSFISGGSCWVGRRRKNCSVCTSLYLNCIFLRPSCLRIYSNFDLSWGLSGSLSCWQSSLKSFIRPCSRSCSERVGV